MAQAYPVSDDAGIDYSHGQENRDWETGCHYGVIYPSAEWLCIHTVMDKFASDYGYPACPVCGGEVIDSEDFDFTSQERPFAPYIPGACDYVCTNCFLILAYYHVYRDEPESYLLNADDYLATFQDGSDIIIVKSPFYTYAQYCSPCVPGAGNLCCPCFTRVKDKRSLTGYRIKGLGPKTYCFGHDWFYFDAAPYPVFSVATNEEILPPTRTI